LQVAGVRAPTWKSGRETRKRSPVREAAVGPLLVRADVDPPRHVRAVLAAAARDQVQHLGLELVAEDDRPGAGVADDEGEFLGREAPVQRHADGADLGHREEGLHVLDAVHQQQRHAVALAHAEFAERVRGPVRAEVPLREREAALALDVDEALHVR